MTSKSLFTNLLKENIKRQIWTIVLSCLAFFFALPVTMAAVIQNAKAYDPSDEYLNTIEHLISNIGAQSVFVIAITVVGAVLCGISSFSYLHSKKKIDLYHSLPLKRELLFGVHYVNGLIIYVIPYLISLLVSLLITKANGYLTAEVAMAGFIGFGLHTLFYSVFYTCSIIAVLLTGNIFISLCACGTLLLYGPAVYMVGTGMFENFFFSYSSIGLPVKLIEFLSPLTFYYQIISDCSYGSPYVNFSAKAVCITILLLALLIVVSILLYKKRASEAAGKAIAFLKIESPVKFLIVIPVSLAAGLFGQNLVSYGSFSWFLFGALCGFLLCYGVMEIIYHFDIKKAFAHKVQLLACGIITFAVILLFKTDAFGYDSYLPDENDIESMSVHFASIDQYLDCYEYSGDYLSYVSTEKYALDHMKLTDFSAAYKIVEDYLATQDGAPSSWTETEADWYTNLSVKYTLKSGRCVYRYYFIDGSEYEDLIAQIYNSAAYKEGTFPAFQMHAEEFYDITCNGYADSKLLTLSAEDKVKFLELYKKDLYSFEFKNLRTSAAVAALDFSLGSLDRSYYVSAYVYPEFTNTIAFLKEHGFDCMEGLNPENVIDLTIHQYQWDESAVDEVSADSAKETAVSVAAQEMILHYQDSEQIAQILPYLVSRDFQWGNDVLLQLDNTIEVCITYRLDDYGNTSIIFFSFPKGSIPDFVKEDLGR